jgi:hypothetical protein
MIFDPTRLSRSHQVLLARAIGATHPETWGDGMLRGFLLYSKRSPYRRYLSERWPTVELGEAG